MDKGLILEIQFNFSLGLLCASVALWLFFQEIK